MRICGGEARGTRLSVPKGVRPASERVRHAVFSSLAASVPGARVLDLYCGSGAYGLEALSRGASEAVFVDKARDAQRVVKRNADAARLGDRIHIRQADVVGYLGAEASDDGPFDLVFCDPPYGDVGAVGGVLGGLEDTLAPDGRVVAETRWGTDEPDAGVPWVLEADRRYGDTRVLVYRRRDTGDRT